MKSYHFSKLLFSLVLPIFWGAFLVCVVALPQEMPRQEQQRQDRSEVARQSLQQAEERLWQRQEWLDNERQERATTFSEEILQKIQEGIEEDKLKLLERRRRIDSASELKEYILDLLQKSFAHREQIKSGQMVVTKHYVVKNQSNGNVNSDQTRKITLSFDEERKRADTHNTGSHFIPSPDAPSPVVSYDSVGCIGCYKGDNRLLFEYTNFSPKRKELSEYLLDSLLERSVMHVYDINQLEENIDAKHWTDEFGFMPQYLAIFCLDRLPTKERVAEAQSYLFVNAVDMLDSGGTDVTITEEDYKGTLCKKITFELQTVNSSRQEFSILNTLWIAEGQGYALRKQHFQYDAMSEELLEVDVALDKDSGIWFPSAWHYEKNMRGKPYVQENGTVKNVILNQPLPEKLFDMKDLKVLPAGVLVSWRAKLVPPPHGGQWGELLWDGNDFVTRGMFAENLVASYAAENKSKRIITILLVNIAVISLLSGIYLLRYYRHLKQQN